MNRLTKYMFRQGLGVTLFVTFGLTAAAWLIQALKLIELVVDHGVSVVVFLEMAVLALPQLLALVIPIGCFIGVLFTFNKMISDSELVVMRACGLSQWMLAKPALLLAGFGMLAMLSLSVYFLPASKNAFKDLQFRIRNEFTSVLLQEGTFNNVSDTLTVYVRARDASDGLNGMLIQDTRDKLHPVTLTAERGFIVQVDGNPRVLMMKGTKQSWDSEKRELSVLTFDQWTLDLNDYRDAPGARVLQADERFLPDLFAPTDADHDPVLRQRLLVEGHNRLLNPLYCFAYVAVALACLLTGQLNRRGHAKRLLAAYAIVAALQGASLGCTNLASRNLAALPLIYLNVLVPLIIGLVLVLAAHHWRSYRYVGREASA